MSTHSVPANTRHFRASSSQQGASSYSKFSPSDKFYETNLGYIKRYLSKFDDCPEKNDFLSKLEESRSFSAQKNMNDNSYTEQEQKPKEVEEYASKTDMSRRLNNLEHKVNELSQKLAGKGLETRQEDNGKINDRFSCIEKRVDMIDRKLEKLTATLETFMQRFQGHLAPQEGFRVISDELRMPIEHTSMRKEAIYETEERLPEIKLLENNFTKSSISEPATEQKTYTAHRRAQSKDTIDIRDRVRESLDQVGRKRDEIVLQAKQSSYRDRVGLVEPKVLAMEQPDRNRMMMKSQDRPERFDTRESLDAKAPPKLKGSLKSPDTARKRKNVSWSENCISEGNIEGESGHKRKRMDTSESNDYERYNENKYEKKRDDSETVKRARELIEEKYILNEAKGQRGASASKEEDIYEKQMRYITGDVRTEKIKSEVEKLEEKLRKIEATGKDNQNHNVTDKERQLEEKRRKIDEEIQRRINKQVDIKKRENAAETGQRRMPQYESDLKTNSYDQDGLLNKEMMSRSELLAKYSDIMNSSAKKSKNV